jgi:hypothetical protein
MVAEDGPSGMEFDEAEHLLVADLDHFLQHKQLMQHHATAKFHTFRIAFAVLTSHSRCNEDDVL